MAAAVTQFEERAARHVERLYQTPDVVEQRAAVLRSLALRASESVLDVGCGPGFLMASMAETTPRVVGIDPSESMRDLARRRCPGLKIEDGQATALPFDDGEFDVVVATQVYEYVEDVPAALAEARRVLQPGGRLLVLDTDWDSAVCASSDDERTRRVLHAYDAHCADAHLPRRVPALLRAAGFDLQHCAVVPLFNARYDPDTYGYQMLLPIARFAERHGVIDADDWLRDIHERGERGDYFFSLNRYLFVALTPAANEVH